MLDNIQSADDLGALARAKAKEVITKTIKPNVFDAALEEGWELDKRNSQSVRLKKAKPHGTLLEDRVWRLFYKMGFSSLSGNRGSKLTINPKDESSPTTQIDVVALDDEVALAVECKSAANYGKRPQFQEELAKLVQIRDKFALAVRTQFPSEKKRQIALLFFVNNVQLTDNDRLRAKNANVIVFDEHDLNYYDGLVSHIGPAARYQFLADLLPGKTIAGLEIKVPAIKSRMGGFLCYTFSVSPEYLLKVSYVSHRAKGKASDVNTYQRMLKKGRLNQIREYIENDGIFPTNIVVNIEKSRIQFDRIHQDSNADVDVGTLGWLTLRPAYKSAWIIDGQHRLFAYSGQPKASKSKLAILAFEGLAASKQAELFVDINAKQKSVKRSLLEELYAELHWDSDDLNDRVAAIVSRAILDLDMEKDSAFYRRIQKSDDVKDPLRCISLTGMFGAIKTRFHIAKEKNNEVVSYGPLWAGTNEKTLSRTVRFLKSWFGAIRDGATEWWEKGAGEGGGLSMNDGVIACVNVLRSVLVHLDGSKYKLVELDDDDLVELIQPYAKALGAYLGSLNEEERKRFRDLRGVQGQNKRTRVCQAAMRTTFSQFSPPGLDDYLEAEKAQTNLRSKEAVDRIETMLHSLVLEELHREFPNGDDWWLIGVPKEVRKKVTNRYEEEDGKRGGKEHYFDLIDYRHIATHNWTLFENLIGQGKGGKDKKLAWLDFVNEKRKVVSHVSSGVTLSIEDLNRLQESERWLEAQISGKATTTAAGTIL